MTVLVLLPALILAGLARSVYRRGAFTEITRWWRGASPLPTYEETVYDSAYGTLLRRSTLLAEDDTVLSSEESVYDDQNRLRYTSYSDGTSRTNAYSCCRLLWSRDREGRKVFRSARTGTDHLYSAEEDVWLADISEDRRFRVTQHFSDGLGRETNRVVYAASVQGEAVDPVVPPDDAMTSRTIVEYPRGGSDYVIRTDERGKVTEAETRLIQGGTENSERVLTNEVEVLRTTSRSYFGGGSSYRREWDGCWTEETRFTEYSPDGMRMEYTVASASDSPAFTNSVTAYDMLGRMVWRETPLSLEEYEYYGSSSRVMSVSEKKSGIVIRYRYNEFGEEAAVVRDGVESVQETSYVREEGQCWRRSRSAVVADGVVATSTTVSERLTCLSDSLRSMSVTVTDGVTNSVERSWFNAAESVKVSETVSPVFGTNTSYSVYGISPKSSSPEGRSYAIHDAFGRVVRTFRSKPGSEERIPVGWTVRNAAGDVVCEESYTNETATVRDLYTYDALGNRTESVNALGDAEFRRYNAMGMVSATGGTTYPVKYSYDTKGRRTSLSTTRDGTAQDTTSWTFDPLTGLCTSKRYQDGSSVAYTYAQDGLLLRTEYAGGRWKENQYNSRRQVAGVTYSDGEESSFAYDSFSRKAAESNSNSRVEYHRNLKGLPTNEVITVGTHIRTISREYDDYGRLARNDGTYYTYAADGRLEAVSNEVATVRYRYTPDRLNAGYTVALSSGTLIERNLVRDAYRRSLVTAITSAANGVQVQRLDYGYDALDRPVRRNADAFGYNRRSEITNACISGSATTYGYDEIGNSSRYSANSLNQYTDFAYDADGNMLTDGIFSFAYDGAGRLKSVSSNGVVIVANDYDSKSRRVRKTTPEYVATYFYDDWNLIEERVAWTNGTSTVFRYYWGKDLSESLQGAGGVGGLLYMTVDGAVYVPCYDNNGNITCYLDETGAAVAEYVYDAFGNTVSATGPLAGVFRHRFSTKYLDSEAGLYYYGYRFYHPQLMRWLTRDPIEEDGGVNLYAMCDNSMIFNFDILGRDGASVVVEGLGAGWAGATVSLKGKTAVQLNGELFYLTMSHQPGMYNPLGGPSSTLYLFKAGKVSKCLRLDFHAIPVGSNKPGVWHMNVDGGAGIAKVTNSKILNHYQSPLVKSTGRTVTIFKHGGKICFISGAAIAAVEIYKAENRVQETIRQVGGWTGAYFGGRLGASAGAKIGMSVAIVTGQSGPQIAVPEELVTVPVFGFVGGVFGGLAGGIAGGFFGTAVAEKSYDWIFTPLEKEEWEVVCEE